jgi:hypothetical protein
LSLFEVPVGQEAELQRCDGALDRHVDHVHHDPTALEVVELRRQNSGPFEVVEREDPLHPARPGETFSLLGYEPGAGGHDEDVVAEHRPVGQVHLLGFEIDALDRRLPEPTPGRRRRQRLRATRLGRLR